MNSNLYEQKDLDKLLISPIVREGSFAPDIEKEEQVLCIPSSISSSLVGERIEDLTHPVLIGRDMVGIEHSLLMAGRGNYRPLWVPRSESETREDVKQIIPYCVFTGSIYSPETDIKKETRMNMVYTYFRGKGQGEKRLKGKMSIGIGGHINPPSRGELHAQDLLSLLNPLDFNGVYMRSLIREIHEEIYLATRVIHKCVGVLYDPTTPVGRVHIGIVHRFHCEILRISSKEEGIFGGEFKLLPLMRQLANGLNPPGTEHWELEPWTKIVLQNCHMLWD